MVVMIHADDLSKCDFRPFKETCFQKKQGYDGSDSGRRLPVVYGDAVVKGPSQSELALVALRFNIRKPTLTLMLMTGLDWIDFDWEN